MSIDVGTLLTFVEVARAGSMSRAAERLDTVQSNVTRQMRVLELDAGVPLLRRHSRGVELTDAGRRLLPYAEQLERILEEASDAVRDTLAPAGPLVLGSLETTAALRLPPVLAAYTSAYPDVDVTLVTNTTAALVTMVLKRELQGALVCGRIRHPDLDETPIFRERLVLVTAPGVQDLDAVLRQPEVRSIVFRAGCSYRQRLEAALGRRGVMPSRTLEFGTVEGILGCVAAGIGVTLLPFGVVKEAATKGRVVVHELPANEADVLTVFVRRKDRELSRALACFLEIAHQTYAEGREPDTRSATN